MLSFMGQNKLNSLALLCMEYELLERINADDVTVQLGLSKS